MRVSFFFITFVAKKIIDMSEPLAERMRPRSLADYVGQKHLVGEGAVLRKMIDAGRISSFILWDLREWARLLWLKS